MSECKIYLENYSGSYYAGGEIIGRVECNFDDETTLRGVKIRLKCKEHNQWTGTQRYRQGKKTRTRIITLTGNRYVLYVEQMLFGSDFESRVLSRGKHVYPFSFVLPHDIPSSYNGPYGGIAYKFKAVVDRPMRLDYEDNFDFTVVSPIDFNRRSRDLHEVRNYSDEKTLCCWCCQGDGVITLDVELPKLAFVPGEVISLKATVSNLSNSNVDNLKVKLIKTITYKVTSPKTRHKEDITEIISLNKHGVGAHGEHTYDLQLAIPEYIDVPNFTNCELFQVNYHLNVSCEMPACTLDLDISVNNIELGHIQYYDGSSQPAGGTYPLSTEDSHPTAGGSYPPPAGGSYPPQSSAAGSSYPPATYPDAPPAYGNSLEKPVYPGGQQPTAPTSSIANAPTSSIANAPIEDNPNAESSIPYVPYESPGSEPPPPSYNQALQNASTYPPQ